MRSLSSKNWGVNYLLYVIDVFTKHAWVRPLKDKKLIVIVEIVNKSKRKPNKLWVDKQKKLQ